jgi:FkbM family methyltransferase
LPEVGTLGAVGAEEGMGFLPATRAALCRVMLPVFQRLHIGDIVVRHHWTGRPIVVHSFKHRSYWYHGRRREHDTMILLARLCSPGDWVIDIGGHIGYVSVYLASLVTENGRVTVFEPGPNNLPYLRRNVAGDPAIELIEKAVTDQPGSVELFTEDLSGQNNSIVRDYRTLTNNQRRTGIHRMPVHSVRVSSTTLDREIAARSRLPSLIKIDVEGAELQVLRGMELTLAGPCTALVLEITENCDEVFDLLSRHGFVLFTPQREAVRWTPGRRGDFVCVKPSDPRYQLFT